LIDTRYYLRYIELWIENQYKGSCCAAGSLRNLVWDNGLAYGAQLRPDSGTAERYLMDELQSVLGHCSHLPLVREGNVEIKLEKHFVEKSVEMECSLCNMNLNIFRKRPFPHSTTCPSGHSPLPRLHVYQPALPCRPNDELFPCVNYSHPTPPAFYVMNEDFPLH
jgi:hypothetical protein